MRAVVVLPTPRTPVSTKACAMRPVAIALVSVRTIASWPISSAKVAGRYLRARTRYGIAGSVMRACRVRNVEACRAGEGGAAGGKQEDTVGDWTTTRAETRYGCFLPDLTGLARDPSAASLPTGLYQDRGTGPQDRRAGGSVRAGLVGEFPATDRFKDVEAFGRRKPYESRKPYEI